MVTEDQAEAIAFLASPSAHAGAPVERIDTHSAIVFLAGARALKLKRAVRYDYLDFSTAARRHAMCDAEVRVNSRTAPSLYRGVLPIVRDAAGALAMGGEGTIVDWVVEMRRFDQHQLLDRLADAGCLPLEAMPALGHRIAEFHRDALRRPDHGGSSGMGWVIDGNADGLREFGQFLDQAQCAQVIAMSRRQWQQRRDLVDARRVAGYVRECHGDLHLRNLVMLDGQPTLFDAIEFNDEIACIDVIYDLAFLLMDLWHRQLPVHANRVLNGYLADTFDPEGLRLLPFFLSCRAAVRAKTCATAATIEEGAGRSESIRLAHEYLALAHAFLDPASPGLVAIGGFSGSGKSTLALTLAPEIGAAPGAVVLRSDEIRKRMFGFPPLQRLTAAAYTSGLSATVYRKLTESAGLVLSAGQSVVVDAVFARDEDRRAIENVAAASGVPFTGLWLDAPEHTLVARIRARHADVSDADERVVQRQVANGSGTVRWIRVDATDGPERVLSAAREAACLPMKVLP